MSRVFIAILFIQLSSCIIAKKTNTNVESKHKYCFEKMSMEVYLAHYGPTRKFMSGGEWYNEYCDGICRQDSLIISYKKNDKFYYDTVVRPILKPLEDGVSFSIPFSRWLTENKSLINKYPVLLNDSLLFKGFENNEPVYIPISK